MSKLAFYFESSCQHCAKSVLRAVSHCTLVRWICVKSVKVIKPIFCMGGRRQGIVLLLCFKISTFCYVLNVYIVILLTLLCKKTQLIYDRSNTSNFDSLTLPVRTATNVSHQKSYGIGQEACSLSDNFGHIPDQLDRLHKNMN